MKVPPAAVINIIRENLNDRYRKGFPILKELVQNADDANTTQLNLGWVTSLEGVEHPLLGGSALFVVNNGDFTVADGEAIDCIGLSSKAGSKFSVGKFGLGLKSIFHVCESFFYIAVDGQTNETVAHIVNPWADNQGRDEFHQGWSGFSSADQQAIVNYLKPILSQERFFCLWIPLRRQDQLQGRAPITKDFPGDADHAPEFLIDHGDTQFATLLPMLRSLRSITTWLPDHNGGLKKSFHIQLIDGANRRRYPFEGNHNRALGLNGQIKIERFNSPVIATESHKFGGFELLQAAPVWEQLKKSDIWPSSGSTHAETGAYIINQDKAEPHCAVCFNEYPVNGTSPQLTTSLAVFLSVDEPPFKPVKLAAGDSNFTLTLHGYFFLDAGRSRIEGLEAPLLDKRPVDDEQTLRFEWNARLFQQGTLPLLLPALHQFIHDVRLTKEKVEVLTGALAKSALVTNSTYRAGVCRYHQWVYCIGAGGNIWKLLKATDPIFEIPSPPTKDPKRPFIVFPALNRISHLTVRAMPRLTATDQANRWDKYLPEMLNIQESVVFGSQGNLDYLLDFLENYAGLASSVPSPHITARLLHLARRAFRVVDLTQLGSYRSRVQRFIKLIPSEQRFVLRLSESLEKADLYMPVMSALLADDLNVLLVLGGFDPPDAPSVNRLKSDDAIKILSRLARFKPARMSEDRYEELQTAIALRIITAVQVGAEQEQVLKHSEKLTLFRGYDVGAGREVSLPLRTLNELGTKRTLFRFANPQADPNTWGEASRLQKALRNSRIVLVRAEIANLYPQEITACTARACVETLVLRPTLSAVDHRVELLTSLSGQLDLYDPSNRRSLRYLLHGQPQQYDADEITLLVGEVNDTQNIWGRITERVLALDNANWRVIDRTLSDNLTPNQRQKLGIEAINRSGVEAILKTESHFAEVNRRLQFSVEDCDLLLVEISDNDIVKQLKIHETVDGRRVAIDDRSYWVAEEGLSLSVALQKQITLLRRHSNPDLAEKQKRLAPLLTPTTAIEIVFSQATPGLYWPDIMNALTEISRSLDLPLDDLRQKEWLPVQPTSVQTSPGLLARAADMLRSMVNQSEYITPQDVIHLPGLDNEVARLTALDQAYYDIEKLDEQLRQHPAFEKLLEFHIFPNSDQALDMLGQIMKGHAQFRLGELAPLDNVTNLKRFLQVLRAVPPDLMPAYTIINAVGEQLSPEASLEYLLPYLKHSLEPERMVSLLNFLADQHIHAGNQDKEKILEVHGWYLTAAVKTRDFSTTILPHIQLLNQLDEWRSPAMLCHNIAGIDKADLLCDMHGRILPGTRYTAASSATTLPGSVTWPSGQQSEQLAVSVRSLKEYFLAWEGALEHREVIGGFLCFLGDHPELIELTKQYLGNRDTDRVRDMVQWKPIAASPGGGTVGGTGEDAHQTTHYQRFIIAITKAETSSQTVMSLLGQPFEARLEQETNISNLVAGDEHKKFHRFIDDDGQQINHLCLRQINPARHSTERLSALLKATTAWLLQDIYLQPAPNLERVWEELEQSEQLDIQLTQALLLESAFFYLRQLGVQSDQELGSVLQAWEKARRQLVQHDQLAEMGRQSNRDEAVAAKHQAMEQLKELIEGSPATRALTLKAVRSKVYQSQYKPQSVPFELFQNADDAVVELEAVTGQTETLCAISWDTGQISLMHWGRPINEFRFGDFDGREPQYGYDRDLEKMLVLSYSDKMDSPTDVTGKFGLGFKSVFLITDQPRILSGRLGFEIVGGLYPQRIIGQEFEQLAEKISQESPDRYRRGTLFELPLLTDIQAETVMAEFKQLVHIMLAFSKRIRRCKLYPGQTRAVEIEWRAEPVLDCAHITVGQLQPIIGQAIGQTQTAVMLKNDKGALLLSLGARGFTKFPDYVPTLWVTVPTQEKLDLGVALNGPFYLDVGRAQLARVSNHNQELAREIGDELGKELCQLFTAAQSQWSAFRQALNLAQDTTPYEFWDSLWTILGDGFSRQLGGTTLPLPLTNLSQDEKQSSITVLLRNMLWGTGETPRGLGRLITEHRALPTHLPGYYQTLTMTGEIQYATHNVLETGLQIEGETKNIFSAVSDWSVFRQTVQPGTIVRGDVKRVVQKLLPGQAKAEDVSLAKVISWELAATDRESRVGVESANRLGELVTPQFMNDLERKASLDYEALRGYGGPLREARFKAMDGKHYPARELLLLVDDTENAEPDEQLRAAFAPDNRVLAEEYRGEALQFFKACRGQMVARVRQELAEWTLFARVDNKCEAVLTYLLKGAQAAQLTDILIRDRDFRDRFRKSWLADVDKSSIWFRFSNFEQQLLRLKLEIQEPLPPTLPPKSPAQLLIEIYDRWHIEKAEHIKRYEKQTYLDGFPQVNPMFEPDDAIERQQWLSLFMLGSFQTIGRSRLFQHRGFLHFCQDNGWLDTFSIPPDPETKKLNADKWMAVLDQYIDPEDSSQQDTQFYHQWMKQFISIYQLARWLPDYVDVFLSTQHYPNSFSMDQITSPRTNPYLQGGGVDPPQFTRTLGLGANFVMRELARNGILSNPFVYEHCFVPTKQVRDFFERFEDYPRYSQGSVDDSRQIHKYLVKHLGEEKATFDLSFDLPFRY